MSCGWPFRSFGRGLTGGAPIGGAPIQRYGSSKRFRRWCGSLRVALVLVSSAGSDPIGEERFGWPCAVPLWCREEVIGRGKGGWRSV